MSTYSQYLEEYIQTELTKALSEAALQNPKDPVDYIGKYLLRIIAEDNKAKENAAIRAKWREEDEALELKEKERQSRAQQKIDDQNAEKLGNEAFYAQLANSSCRSDALQSWSEWMEKKTQSSSVYIAQPCQITNDDQQTSALLYEAVSCKENEFLLSTTFVPSESKGVVLQLLKPDANTNDNEDADAAAEQNEPQTRNKIHIENVLLPGPYQEKLHFFKYPKVGSFLAFQSAIKSYLSKEAIQAELRPQWPQPIEEIVAPDQQQPAVENKEDNTESDQANEEENQNNEEEQKEVPPDPPQVSKQFVVCMDTLGGEQYYDDTMIEWIEQNVGKLEQTLMQIDVKEYLQQRQFQETFDAKLKEYQDALKSEIDAKLSEIEKENEANPEPIKLFSKQKYVIEATQSLWSVLAECIMKPEDSSFCRVVAAFVKLFEPSTSEPTLSVISCDLAQYEAMSDRAWSQCAQGLRNVTLQINEYNPAEIQSFDCWLVETLLKDINAESIGSEGLAVVVSMLYEFVVASYNVFKHVPTEESTPENTDNKDNEEIV